MVRKSRYTDDTSFRLKSQLHLSESWETSIRIIRDHHNAFIRILHPKNIPKLCKLQTTAHVVKPHADKIMINTGREDEIIFRLRNHRLSIMDHVTYILFTTGIRMDEYHPWCGDREWEIWVNIGAGNGLLPDGTKPLPQLMLTDHQ